MGTVAQLQAMVKVLFTRIAHYENVISVDETTKTATIQRDNITATADGLVLTNTSPATSTNKTQYSPAIRLHGSGYGFSASNTIDWRIENQSNIDAAVGVGWLNFKHSLNNAAYTTPMSIRSDGVLTISEFRTTPGQYVAYGNTGVRTGGTQYYAALGYAGNASSYGAEIDVYGRTHATLPGIIQFRSGTASAQQAVTMTLDASGNLGIATASPDSRLDIEDGAISLKEMTAPGAPASDKVVIYAVDNGGKTQLCARFPTGAVQQLAIEP